MSGDVGSIGAWSDMDGNIWLTVDGQRTKMTREQARLAAEVIVLATNKAERYALWAEPVWSENDQ